MEIRDIPFQVFDLANMAAAEHPGITGTAFWKTIQKGDIRVRIVQYTAGYLADHWCKKGHVVFVLEGSFETELKDGSRHGLAKGMCYLVSDNIDEHRSYSKDGVTLLIVDQATDDPRSPETV
jgi:hypothetical protein